jgi:hypothetical protein
MHRHIPTSAGVLPALQPHFPTETELSSTILRLGMRMIANEEASRGFKSTGDVESYRLSAIEPTKHGDEHVRQVHIALPTAIVSDNPLSNASQRS